jgi:hypothetical protein
MPSAVMKKHLFPVLRFAWFLWYNFSMEKIAIDGPKMPIGFLSSLWKGIELVNTHPGVLIIPACLDFFLWFGPHLSVYGLVKPFIDTMSYNLSVSQTNAAMMDVLRQMAQRYNLLSLLSFVPLFPPSLMAGVAPIQTPFGNPAAFPISNWPECLGLALGLLPVSLLIGATYWILAGRITQVSGWSFRDTAGRWFRTLLVTLLLCFAFFFLILAFAFPILFLLSLLAYASPEIGTILSQLFFFLGGGLLFWVVLFIMFSMHGTALYRDGILSGIWNSINTSRWLYPLSIWIPILLIMVNYLASTVWSLAPENSWAGALGILGNAYTSSVVIVASMVYYIDKRRWITEVRTYLQSRMADKNPPGVA